MIVAAAAASRGLGPPGATTTFGNGLRTCRRARCRDQGPRERSIPDQGPHHPHRRRRQRVRPRTAREERDDRAVPLRWLHHEAVLRRTPFRARFRGRRAGCRGRRRPLRGNLPPAANIERLDRRDEPPPVEHFRYRPGAKPSLAALTLGRWPLADPYSSAPSAGTRVPNGTGAALAARSGTRWRRSGPWRVRRARPAVAP
jgi:hypothetical protein